jgi:hypothetical protein
MLRLLLVIGMARCLLRVACCYCLMGLAYGRHGWAMLLICCRSVVARLLLHVRFALG